MQVVINGRRSAAHGRVSRTLARHVVGIGRKRRAGLNHRHVHQCSARAVGIGVPAVRALPARLHDGRLAGLAEARLGQLNRPTGLQIDMAGPSDRGELVRRQQLAAGRIEHIEKPVLGFLHQHVPAAGGQIQVSQHHRAGGIKVPGLSRRGLVVPGVGAGVGIDRDDGIEEQVVAAARTARLGHPRCAIGRTEIDQVGLRVIGDAIPNRTAAQLPVQVALPGGGRLAHLLVFIRLGRVARHGIKAPQQLAAARVIGRHIAAHTDLGAAVANDDLAVGHARRTGAGIGLGLIDGDHLPHGLAGLGVERDQAAVIGTDIDLAVISSHAAVDHIAATLDAHGTGHLRIEMPQGFAAAGIEGIDLAPSGGHIEHAIDHQRRGFLTAVGVEVGVPGQPQLRDIGGVDLRQRTVALLVLSATHRQPLP